MQQEALDIIVIGGGIQGAGIAQAAAAAGYSVLVLEKYPKLAQGTSSRSSKLIHGGLRYLETGQFSLVKECLQERALLLKNAPHLVKEQTFYLPAYRHSKRKPATLFMGLSLYALLGKFKKHNLFSVVPKKQWPDLYGLKKEGLLTVFRYNDAQTDDQLLTQAVMQSALNLGAKCFTNAEVVQITLSSNDVATTDNCVNFKYQGKLMQRHARVVVNATGPWVEEICKLTSPKPPSLQIDLVKGSHIIIDRRIAPSIFYLEALQDKRAILVMPWKNGALQNKTLIGTTEISYQGDPGKVEISSAEIHYFLENINYYFPGQKLTKSNIAASFSGLRVLPDDNKAPFLRTRETVLIPNEAKRPKLLSIYGGKLTTYRSTAEKVLKLIKPSLPYRQALADTKTLSL